MRPTDKPLPVVTPQGPLVSVVIPAHNAAHYLPATLASILGQTYRPIEVIVVDDGSTDGTPEVLSNYPDVTRYRRDPAGGPSAARNLGIQRATGPYIAFLDADDLWPADKLAEQVEFMEAHPEVELLFGNARRFSDDGWTEPPLFERHRVTPTYFGKNWLVVDAVSKLLENNFIPTGTVITRKAFLVKVGLFDERFSCAEDWELWLRVALVYPLAHSTRLWKLKRVHQHNLSGDLVRMTEQALAVIEKLRDVLENALSGSGVSLRRCFRDKYRGAGYLYLRHCRLSEARAAFEKSLALGVRPRTLVYWCSTFLGRSLVAAVLRARNSDAPR